MRALHPVSLCAAIFWALVGTGPFAGATTSDGSFYNEDFLNNTGADQNTLSVYLAGDWRNNITTSYNPFGAGTTYDATYDPTGNLTTIAFTGPNPVAANGVGHIGYGLVGGGGAPHGLGSPATTGKSLGTGTGLVYEPASTLSVSAIVQPIASELAQGAAPTQWVVLFANLQAPGSAGSVSSALEHEWAEFPVPGDAFPLTVFFSNEGAPPMAVTLSQVGYLLASSQIPLANLNATNLPGSAFTPLGIADGTMLTPGAFVSAPILVPEPAAGLGLAWIAGLLLVRRRLRCAPGGR